MHTHFEVWARGNFLTFHGTFFTLDEAKNYAARSCGGPLVVLPLNGKVGLDFGTYIREVDKSGTDLPILKRA